MAPETFYHIYNRGNNRHKIFFQEKNYLYFLDKIRKHLLPHIHILAWCLMPNHFHLLVYSKADIVEKSFYNDLRIMLSSYTRAINKQENRIGSLFQQNTKIKLLEHSDATTPSGGTANNKLTSLHTPKPDESRTGKQNGRLDYEFLSGLCWLTRRDIMPSGAYEKPARLASDL